MSHSDDDCSVADETSVSVERERIIPILTNIFAAVADHNTIQTIAASCNGNLSNAIERLMTVTSTPDNSSASYAETSSVNNAVDEGQSYQNKSSVLSRTPINFDDKHISEPSTSQLSRNKEKVNHYSKTAKMNSLGLNKRNRMLPQTGKDDLSLLDPDLRRIIGDINEGYRVLILMRGLPGSGKSTLAKIVINMTVKNSPHVHVCSSDDYFFNSKGKYIFDSTKLSAAHMWNQNRVDQFLRQGISPIIIDNTNTEAWEMKPYAVSGVKNGYSIEVLEPRTSWALKVGELNRKNVHGVPLNKIKLMLERYERNMTTDVLLKSFQLRYSLDLMPPILRSKPEVNKAPPVNWYDEKRVVSSNILEPVRVVQPLMMPDPHCVLTNNYQCWNNQANVVIPNNNPFAKAATSGFPDCFPYSQNRIPYQNSQGQAFVNQDNAHYMEKHLEAPKPQRTVSHTQKKMINSDCSILNNVDWETIDTSMSSWVTCEILEVPPVSTIDAIETKSVSTNTQSFDINPANMCNFTVLKTTSRDINFYYIPTSDRLVPSNGYLDKGTMTNQYEHVVSSTGQGNLSKIQQLKEFSNLIENIPDEDVEDLLQRCDGDLNWAFEILLEAKSDHGFIDFSKYRKPGQRLAENVNLRVPPNASTSAYTRASAANLSEENLNATFKLHKKEKTPSETATCLKKEIEQNFAFGDHHYSNHILKIKNRNHGENPKEGLPAGGPGTEAVPEAVHVPEEPSYRSASESSEEAEEDVLSVRMGSEFFSLLNDVFGTVNILGDHLEPIINMPMSLLTQLHALWLESVCNQLTVHQENMKVIIREDEEFARQIEETEREYEWEGNDRDVPDLKQIMDMEMALAVYNAEWKNESPTDLASKLSRKKLIELFPDLDKNVLMEIYNASNNNFEQTFQEVLISTGRISMAEAEGFDQKEIQRMLVDQEKKLIEKAMTAKEKAMNPTGEGTSKATPYTSIEGCETQLETKSAVDYYRNEAKEQLIMRNNHYSKARDYFEKGMTAVATYYSQMAALHIKKHDHANSLVASGILQISAGKDNSTIDLHHLYVAEAMQVLDVFLDKHINSIRTKLSKLMTVQLFIITGRGKHSPGGQPRIKPAVKRRLEKRTIRYSYINEGLLAASVTAHDLTSTELLDSAP